MQRPGLALSVFHHAPLESDNHIRLLKIVDLDRDRGGFINEPIQILELVQFNRDNCPPYEAVSYTWGDLAHSCSIFFLNGEMQTTKELSIALPYLTRSSYHGYLWIDQLCIDQDNVEERNKQVLLMGEIYAQASGTLVWLGEDDGSAELLQELSRYVEGTSFGPQGRSPVSKPKWHAINDFSALLDFDRGCMSHEAERRFSAISSILKRSWFTRAWVFQEFVLSRSIDFLVGHFVFSMHIFLGIVLAAKEAELQLVPTSGECTLWQQTGIIALERMIRKVDERSGLQPVEPFANFLKDIGSVMNASDLRDYVYAFLGLLNDDRYLIRPDYSLSVADVFTTTAKAFIEGSESLDILGFCALDGHRRDLPSWVPDWGERPKNLSIYGRYPAVQFCASGHFHHHPYPTDDPARLSVRGCRIGSVTNIIDSFPLDLLDKDTQLVLSPELVEREARSLPDLLTLDELCIKLGGDMDETKPDSTNTFDLFTTPVDEYESDTNPRTLRERILEVIIAGGANAGNSLSSELRMLTAGCIKRLLRVYDLSKSATPLQLIRLVEVMPGQGGRPPKPPMELMGYMKDYNELCRYASAAAGKVLVKGTLGSLGLAPGETQPGDLISILHGSKTPIVLRTVDQPMAYQVVGQCYWESAMHGEAVTWTEEEADQLLLS